MRLISRIASVVFAASLSLGAGACGGGGGDDSGTSQPPVDYTGMDHQYVVDHIQMPTTANEAQQLGLNLDDDPKGRPDNALGQILSTLANQAGGSFNLQDSIDQQVAQGQIILLANMKTKAFTTATGVGTWVFLGANPSNMPCTDTNDTVCGHHLDGSTMFDIDSSSPDDAVLSGQIVGGKFTGGPGTVTIELSLVSGDNTQIVVNLVGAKMQISQASADGLTGGILGGAVTDKALHEDILPALHDVLATTIARDCKNTSAPCCDSGSTGQLLIDLFDESDPQDCMVTLDELENNSLISSLLAPDVDLFDGDPADGNYAPNKDGKKDSLSLGIGFSAVGAKFALPASVTTPPM